MKLQRSFVVCLVVGMVSMTSAGGEAVNASGDLLPEWAIGPFHRPEDPQPVAGQWSDRRLLSLN
jgi:hypothetical protein